MKKLALDELAVDSFVTTSTTTPRRGTVRAQAAEGCSVGVTFGCTLNGQSCFTNCTCEWSCGGSCDFTCPDTCRFGCGEA